MTIEVKFHNSTFLPYEHHLAGSISLPESQPKHKSEDYGRVQHQTNHVDALPAYQIIALAAPSNDMVHP